MIDGKSIGKFWSLFQGDVLDQAGIAVNAKVLLRWQADALKGKRKIDFGGSLRFNQPVFDGVTNEAGGVFEFEFFQ